MKLSYLIDELRPKINTIGDYKTYIIRGNTDETSEDIKEFPIHDIKVNVDDEEINLVRDDTSTVSQSSSHTLTVKDLFNKLISCLPQAADYYIYASHSQITVDDYEIYLDVPIVAYGINEKNSSFGLFQKESDELS